MGNTRLAIIGVANGKQPLSNEDGSLWVTFNGEIYNYVPLRNELIQAGHTFRTNTDTEVLVHGIEQFGVDLLPRLNGMFAFAVWNSTRRELIICRDRVGIKPVYYYHDRGRWVFASEIKAILRDLRNTRKVDVSVICDYLVKQDFFGEESIFVGVNLVPAGSYLRITSTRHQLQTYWTPTFTRHLPKLSLGAGDFGRLLRQAVENQLQSEVPIGAQLSGGLDSSAIVHFARQQVGHHLPVFTCGIPDQPEYDESRRASMVARVEGVQFWTTLLTSDYLRAHIEPLVESLEEPRFNPGVILNDAVAELAKRHVTVVLTGQGGDELFGGYDRFSIAAFWHYLFWTKSAGRSRHALANFVYALRKLGPMVFVYNSILYLLGPYEFGLSILELYHRLKIHRVLVPKFARWSRRGSRKETVRVIRSVMTSGSFKALSPIQRMLWLDIATFLNYLLVTVDKIEMRHSLEARVPLLDNLLLDFVGHLNPDALAGSSPTKALVRAALRGLLPSNITDGPKMGSPIPIRAWFRNELRGFIASYLLNPHLAIGDIIDSRRIRKLVEDHFTGKRDNSESIWRLLIIELWYRRYVTGHVGLASAASAYTSGLQPGEQHARPRSGRVLFVYEKAPSFILGDLSILRQFFEVTEFRWQRPSDLIEWLSLIREVDTIYAWYANVSAIFLGLASRVLRKRLVLVPAGSDVSGHAHGGALRRPLYRFVPMIALCLANRVLAVSEFAKSEILSLHKSARCEVVYNGVDPDVFILGGLKERFVLGVGFMNRETIEWKGFGLLVETARSMPDVRFVIVGELLDDAAFDLRTSAPPNVEFPGFLPLPELLNLYRAAWLFAQLSTHESFGVAVVEAMMSGCIPVLADIPALREVGGEVAEFVESDPRTVASGIRRALERGDSQRVRDWAVSRFSIDRRSAALKQVLGGERKKHSQTATKETS